MMINRTFVVVLMLLLEVSIFGQININRVESPTLTVFESDDVKGKPKVLFESCFKGEESDGVIVSKEPKRAFSYEKNPKYYFDKEGNITKLEKYLIDNNEALVRTIVFDYDKNGRVFSLHDFDEQNACTRHQELTYNEGLIITDWDSLGSGVSVRQLEYNDNDQLIEETSMYNGNPSYSYKWVYEDNITTVLDFGLDGKMREFSRYYFNEEGKKTEIRNYYSDSSLIDFEEMKYDSLGRQISKIVFRDDSTEFESWFREFNEYGDLGYTDFYDNGKIWKAEKYEYTYDEFGNWTKLIVRINEEEIYVYIRAYEYYK